MKSKRKLMACGAAVVCLALLLAGLAGHLTSRAAILQISILNRTNDASGEAGVPITVKNNSPGILNFAYWAEIQTPNGWAVATNWDAQHPGRLYWLRGRAGCNLILPSPAGAGVWRLKFMCYSQPGGLGQKWFGFVIRTGLKKLGVPDHPRWTYLYTPEMPGTAGSTAHAVH